MARTKGSVSDRVIWAQAEQLADGPVCDGDLISKAARNWLVVNQFVFKIHGWNVLQKPLNMVARTLKLSLSPGRT